MMSYEKNGFLDIVRNLEDINYFTFISTDSGIYKSLDGNLPANSTYYYIEMGLNKVNIDEYTNYSYRNILRNDKVSISSGRAMNHYRFVRIMSIKNISADILNCIEDAAMYIFIDNDRNVFSEVYDYMSKKGIPFLKVIHKKYYNINGTNYASPHRLFDYIFENYVP
ncbi:hypothetical protein [Acidiplasma aeolicum]|nr:hypothetical protein [Acidiplasma aeolicum]